MSVWLQTSASIEKRTSPLKFAHLAEKSEKGSISNLSTKVKMARQDSGVSTGRSATKKKRMKNRSFERTGEETPAGKGSPMGETSPEAADGDGASTVSVSTVSVEVTPASAAMFFFSEFS